MFTVEMKNGQRDMVRHCYEAAKSQNLMRYIRGDDRATSEYIYPNQFQDAANIVDKFFFDKKYVVSVQKKTKVGADGLMIEIAKLMTTHLNNEFVINAENLRIITGMSNKSWESEMILKSPSCFKDKIFHHGKLKKAHLESLTNSLIIIDEIDSGDKEFQVLHRVLRESGILDIEFMRKNNIRLVMISATMFREMYDLRVWGDDIHFSYKMTIPDRYAGHRYFLENGIIDEWYAINSVPEADRWIEQDILSRYRMNFRVHFIRVSARTIGFVEQSCLAHGILFRNHTSEDRLTEEDEQTFFVQDLIQHVVVAVKGLLRRANLIPDKWKLRVGAMHEYYTTLVDNNVQTQGFIGRMTGMWLEKLLAGHLTGPFRTSVMAIRQYEEMYDNPYGDNSYRTSRFVKEDGCVKATGATMLDEKHVAHLPKRQRIEIVQEAPARDIRSNRIVIIHLSEEERLACKPPAKAVFRNIVQRHREDIFNEYKDYFMSLWNINTAAKVSKWNLKHFTTVGAYSLPTLGVHKRKDDNVMAMLLYESQLILSPWSGTRTSV